MNIVDRLAEFVKYKRITLNKLASTVGISKGYFARIKGSIGSDKLADIMRIYPELNIEWLILGEEEGRTMLKSPSIINKETNKEGNDISELILNLSKTISDQQGKISSLTEQLKNEEVINNKLKNEIELLKSISKSTRSQKAM